MNKKVFSGILALGMTASMCAIVSGATKLGDVNNDGQIDIEDAVSIISYVNGDINLTDKQEKAADINCDDIVDIEDAVRIITHIHGGGSIPDVVVTGSEDTTGDEDNDDKQPTDDENKEDDNKEDDNKEDDNKEDDNKEDDNKESEPGSRTPKLFAEIADSNYSISFTGEAVVANMATDAKASINQIDNKNSIVSVDMPDVGVNCTLYIVDKKKYKIVDFDKHIFTAKLTTKETLLDFNSIFVNLASNEDAMHFEGQTEDEETGYVIEEYTTAITSPLAADVTVKAYYDKKTDELKKLVMYSDDYDAEAKEGVLYINTDTLNFTPSFTLEGGMPDFSTWTKQ